MSLSPGLSVSLAAAQSSVLVPTAEEPCLPVQPGSNVEPPLVTHTVEPEYPALARKARLQGVVLLRVTVHRDGTVGDVDVIKGLPMGMTERAVAAIRHWRFEPATRDGEPVCARFHQTVNFQLGDETMFGGALNIPETIARRELGDSITVVGTPQRESRQLVLPRAALLMLVANLLLFVLCVVLVIVGLRLLLWLLPRLGFPAALGRFGSAVAHAYRKAEQARGEPDDQSLD